MLLLSLAWSSDLFSDNINIQLGSPVTLPSVTVSGVTLMVTDNNNSTCFNSSLTFTGSSSLLTALDGRTLNCSFAVDPTDTVTIAVPTTPEAPTMMDVSTICGGSNGNQVTLQWTPPTNTGGQGVVITHYNITGLPQSAICSPGPCDMIDGTATTIADLQCNTSYMISVRAVNCVGGVSSSLQVPINLSPPGVPSFSDTGIVNCIDNDTLTLNWTAPTLVQSDCVSSLSYNLTVSDTDSVMTTDTNARVAVDSSDNYTVTIFASNGCPGLVEKIVISTTCVAPSSTVPPSGVSPTTPIPVIASSLVSPIAVTTMIPTTTSTANPPNTDTLGTGPVAGGAVVGIIIVAGLSALVGFILGCVCCPCLECCVSCRKKACGCCPGICCGPYADGVEYGEPTPHYEKQPVKETKEKDVETGQPSYPPAPMYQDPNTIQRQAAPSGDLYAKPEKPARHQKQKPAIEMPTYQDPNTIQRQAAPTTGDLYAQPEKPLKQPPGPAPVYSQVEKPQPGGMEYADLSHSVAPPNARRPTPVADTFYAEVRESRP